MTTTTALKTMSDLTARIIPSETESPEQEAARLRIDVAEQTEQIINQGMRLQRVTVENARLLAVLRWYADPAHDDRGLRARTILMGKSTGEG